MQPTHLNLKEVPSLVHQVCLSPAPFPSGVGNKFVNKVVGKIRLMEIGQPLGGRGTHF